MPEMRRMQCPSCETDNVPLAVVDGITEYRCRECGLVFYGPCGCITRCARRRSTQGMAEAQAERLGDWQMATPGRGHRAAGRCEAVHGLPVSV